MDLGLNRRAAALADAMAAEEEALRLRVTTLDNGARTVVMRPAAPHTRSGQVPASDPRNDPFWARVAAGEAILWPPDLLHAAWTEQSQMRAIVVEFASEDPVWPSGYWGDAEVIEINPKTGERLGGSDARNNGKAVGY